MKGVKYFIFSLRICKCFEKCHEMIVFAGKAIFIIDEHCGRMLSD